MKAQLISELKAKGVRGKLSKMTKPQLQKLHREQREPKDKLASNTNWYKKWYGLSGRHGQIMAEINAILNSIGSRTLGGISPADFVEALMGTPENDDEKETWKQMVDTANATKAARAPAGLLQYCIF